MVKMKTKKMKLNCKQVLNIHKGEDKEQVKECQRQA